MDHAHAGLAETRGGLPAAASAFLIWGLSPLYWKALSGVGPLEIISHRIVWCAPCVGLALLATGRLGDLRAVWASPRTVGLMLISSALVCLNWFTYVMAVNSARVVEASMGYYINPLVNVLLGWVFLRDRMRPLQWAAVILAAAGVANLVLDYGRFPWVALVLAFTFGFYALVRKVVRVDALPGLLFETMLLGLGSAAYLIHVQAAGVGALGRLGRGVDALLVGAGLFTAVPLFLFTFGARRLRLATLGVLQYFAPTGMFLLGVFVYGEPFTATHLVTYVLIWSGVAVYAVEAWSFVRRAGQRPLGPKGPGNPA